MTVTSEQRRRGNIRAQRPVVVNSYDVDAETTHVFPLSNFNRISLRAIFAGVLVALIIMLAMDILGIAIGATTLDAMINFNDDPAFDPEDGVIVWMAATNLIALFVGGWVSARLSGVPDALDGILHGIVTWGVVTLITLWLFTTAAGRILNGAADAVGTGLDTINAGVETVVPAAVDAVDRQQYTLDDIRNEARSYASETGDPALQPNAIESDAEQAGDIVQSAAEDIAQNPSSAADRIETAIDRLLALDAPNEADRQDVVNVLVANTDMTEAEARDTIDTWENRYNDVQLNVEDTINTVSDDVTDAIALAAGVVFMGMLIGAIAAGAGGWLGSPTLADLEAMYVEDHTDE